MKQNKQQYVSPVVETMKCNVERGFSASGCGTYCDDQLEGLAQGCEVNNMFN